MRQNPFNWEEFINWAEALNSQNPTDEAYRRTIISRSYYGIFKQIEDFLESLGRQLPSRIPDPNNPSRMRDLGSHEKVIQYLIRHSNQEVRSFGTILDTLREKRTKADYDATSPIGENESKQVLNFAKMLNMLISQILNYL